MRLMTLYKKLQMYDVTVGHVRVCTLGPCHVTRPSTTVWSHVVMLSTVRTVQTAVLVYRRKTASHGTSAH